jgi:hypothetical protein
MGKISNKFLYVESPQIPLISVDYADIKKETIDPTTGKPYKGIILFGEFADLSNETLNNNKRIYDVPLYLQLLGDLRKKIHEKKGVYGELEHPNSYAVNYKMVSHKILDVYYDEKTKKVMGYVLLLNTPEGKKAQEVVKSGGCLAISGRAAGEEIAQSDGSFLAKVKLLTTYDLVYHPGFSSAVLDFKELNESYNFGRQSDYQHNPYSCIITENQLRAIHESYNQFRAQISGMDTLNECFLGWYSNLNEDQKPSQQQKQQQEKLQDSEQPKEEKYQQKLERAADQDLSEKHKKRYMQILRRNQRTTTRNLKNLSKIGNAVYDNSAGFLSDGLAGLPNTTSVATGV